MKARILSKIFRIIILITILLSSLYLIKNYLLPFFTKLKFENIGLILTTSATLIVGLGAVLITQSKIKKRELAEVHRENKVELYTRFNHMMFKVFAGNNEEVTGENPSEQNLIDFMLEFKRDLMFRASPKVIRAMNDFEKYSSEPGKIIRYADNLYRAMRKDIGLSNFGLDTFQLMQLMLKDKSEIWKIK